jgi:hypothetical protein
VPTIVNPDTLKEQSITDSEALQRLDNGQGLMKKQIGIPGVHLYDMVDGTLSGPFPADLAYTFYLRKIVSRCTACTFSSLFEKDVTTHLRDVQNKVRTHSQAHMKQEERRGQTFEICSVCGASFSFIRGKGADHIESALKSGPLHVGASVQTIQRYSVTPPAPMPERKNSFDFPSAHGNGAVASQTVLEAAHTPRRRRRRHKRKGQNGHQRATSQ